jgi:hypothetical protein
LGICQSPAINILDFCRAWQLLICLATLAGFLGRISWFLELFSHFRFQYLVLLAFSTILFIAGGRYPQALITGLFAALNLSLVLPLYIKGPAQTSSNPGVYLGQGVYRVLLANVLQRTLPSVPSGT